MSHMIDIIGIGVDGAAGLRRELVDRIESADFLAGGERHLSYFTHVRGERFVIKDNVVGLFDELGKRHSEQHCVVLASGDPLFYGIGTYIIRVLGSQHVRIEPAVSSMQLAFARAGLTWQDAALASVHGRDIRTTLLPLLGKPKIGLFTQDGQSPARVAEFFRRFGLAGYQAFVAERLGSDAERITRWADLAELQDEHFGSLNYLILNRTDFPEHAAEMERLRSLVPGAADEFFTRPGDESMMTRQEIRAVLLSRIAGLLRPGDTVWDIGAGLGTVSIEIAVLRPHVEVIAVEQDAERAKFLRSNRERFGAYNIRVIEGTAPKALAEETDSPRLIFIGGSGTTLPMILDDVEQRMRVGGRLLASFVTLENLTTTLLRFRGKGWRTQVTEVQIANSDALGQLTGFQPHRPVFILSADKPGARW